MEDLLDQANEVQDMMGRAYGVPDDIDEDELQAGKERELTFIEIIHMCFADAMMGEWIELDALGDEMFDVEEESPAYLNAPEAGSAPLPNVTEADIIAVSRDLSRWDCHWGSSNLFFKIRIRWINKRNRCFNKILKFIILI